jgi:hypothetical protein
MNRRRLLAGLCTGVSLSGCLGSDSPGTPTAEGTTTTAESTDRHTSDRPPETTTDPETLALDESFEASGVTVTVHDVRVRRIVFARNNHLDPHYRPGHQFLVADVSVSDRDQLGNFAVVMDGDRIETRRNDSLVAFDEPTGELLGLAVPAPLDAECGAVRWTGPDGAVARWTLDSDHLDALAHPPAFEVRNFEIPEEVERGSSFTATLTVSNSGSGGGAFRAELGATTISDTPEIRVAVPASETVTAEQVVEPYYPDDADEATIRLNWDAEFVERTVSIV